MCEDFIKGTKTIHMLETFVGTKTIHMLQTFVPPVTNTYFLSQQQSTLFPQLCALYADCESDDSVFEDLIFLIRDWENDNMPGQIRELVSVKAVFKVSNLMSSTNKTDSVM